MEPILTKKERRFLKRQQKEIGQFKRNRQRKIKRALIIILPILLVVAGASFLVINLSATGGEVSTLQVGTPKMEVNPKEYDLGTVSMKNGVVKKIFEIKNSGDGDLKISGLWTSCHCTTVMLKSGGEESPRFNMEKFSSWSQNIAPGQSGQLEVTFDPAYHGLAGVGPAIRGVYFSTNDPQSENFNVTLSADVIP